MEKVLIIKEKHVTRYFDASTNELMYRAAYKILSERFELGYYYYEPQPLEERLANFKYASLTDKDIANMPEGIREGIESNRQHELRQVDSITDDFKRETLFWKCLLEVLTLPIDEAIEYKHNKMSRIPTVWLLMNSRANHQYEGWEIEEIESC